MEDSFNRFNQLRPRYAELHKQLRVHIYNCLNPKRLPSVLKELVIEVDKQKTITKDNVTVDLNGVLYIKVNAPFSRRQYFFRTAKFTF